MKMAAKWLASISDSYRGESGKQAGEAAK